MNNQSIKLPEMFTPEMWVLEYSPSQKTFNIDSLSYILKHNIEKMFEDRQVDNIVIGTFRTEEDAHEAGYYYMLKKFNGKSIWDRCLD